jgi:hypothetical protein
MTYVANPQESYHLYKSDFSTSPSLGYDASVQINTHAAAPQHIPTGTSEQSSLVCPSGCGATLTAPFLQDQKHVPDRAINGRIH